jgi:hypothetical protein
MLQRKWLRLRYRMRRLIGRVPPPRVAFLHIPKCGGTTIYRHFKTNLGGSRSSHIAHFDSLKFAAFDGAALTRAQRAQFVMGHYGWNALAAVGEGAFRLTVLREPFTRLKSLYLYSRAKQSSDHRLFAPLLEAAKQRSFAEFCLSPEPELRPLLDNAMTRTLAHDYYPLGEWDRERATRDATRHLDSLDLVVDLNDLDAALPRLAKLTDTKLVHRQLRENATPAVKAAVMSRAEFESDAELMSLIAQDRIVYRHAFAPPNGAPGSQCPYDRASACPCAFTTSPQ